MRELKQWLVTHLEQTLGFSPETQLKLWTSLLIIGWIWLLRLLVIRLAYRRIKDIRIRYRLRKTTTYVGVALVLVLLSRIWIKGFENLPTFLGLVSAGLAIALKDPLVNLVGWAFILWRRPFEVGDRIQLGENAGDVIDQRIFMFTLMEIRNWIDADQSTGRVIHVPNGRIFLEALANYSKGFAYIWDEIPVLITFESNWKKAKQILLEIANKHALHLSAEAEKRVKKAAKKFMIFYSKLTPIVYTSVRNSGVLLTIRFLCSPRQRRGAEQAIWEDVLEMFSKCSDIDFAYPTQRFYSNVSEGKPGTRPASNVPRSPEEKPSPQSQDPRETPANE